MCGSRDDIDLVPAGTGALAAGIEQNLWLERLPRSVGGALVFSTGVHVSSPSAPWR
ncbi:hypothetical protein [Paraburkholderia lycopersici]|uniref:hypothetical protein n=1 Tax=Paraburkholderia lycopersici TaxID=416944 RepID=UPI0015A11D7C|nr:hypothetical protein [Paraburkholderia lycopersici]